MDPRELSDLIAHSHAMLDFRLAGCSDEDLVRRLPDATISSIAHIYIHAAMTEDACISNLTGGGRIAADSGFASYLPSEVAVQPEWDPQLLLEPEVHHYVAEVRASTLRWLATVSAEDLDREVPFHRLAIADGRWDVQPESIPIHFFLSDMVLLHTFEHAGEMSALRGVFGGEGFALGAPVRTFTER